MNIIRDRRSVRKYKEEMVDRKTINAIIEDSSFAPSWANTQVARYNIVESQDLIKEIRTRGVNDFIYNVKVLERAKQVMVLSTKQGKSGRLSDGDFATTKDGEWEVFDGGIACQTFCLSAHAHGVGTVIMGVINDKEIKEILSLPEDETVAALVVFGYPDETPNTPARMTVEEISRFL
jgi:nitroreductase